jgi:S-adenosyl-l-methionine hydroxide adenosyltransferase
MLLHLVADYGPGDLAFAEVEQRLAVALPGCTVVRTPVPAFDTVAAGFCVGQLALTDGPPGRVVYHNVAPRADEDDPRPDNQGEALVAAWTWGGTLVVGPHSGHVLSFLRGETRRLHAVEIPGTGSQFRSRDFFPALVGQLANGDQRAVRHALDPGTIPPVPERAVVYVDGYGNLKTSWSEPPAPSGTTVEVSIAGVAHTATVGDGTFEVASGELAFAPGSSGWPCRQGGERRFCELLLRGGSAAELFGHPTTGTRVEVGPSRDR